VVTQVPAGGLTAVEQSLVEHVGCGEWLDLAAGDEAVDEASMRSWGDDRTCSASVIRDILRGRLAPHPDPHGLRLRGARISGRVDLENLTADVNIELKDCLLEDGVLARDARLASVGLPGCQLGHPSEAPLDATRLTCSLLDLTGARIIGHTEHGAVNLGGARIGMLGCAGAILSNDSGTALNANTVQVDQNVFLGGGFTATGAGNDGAVDLRGAHIGGQLSCAGAVLRNDFGTALYADSVQVGVNVFLGGGSTATGAGNDGAVRLAGAHIGGVLDCDGAVLRNDSGAALYADSAQVGQNVFLRGGFTATGAGTDGAVDLRGAHIGGQLSCIGAVLRNDSGPALLADGLQVDQDMLLTDQFTATGGGSDAAVDLTGARVGGTLYFNPARLEHVTDPHRRLACDELTYAGVPDTGRGQDWLGLLRQSSYAAQPYQHLAAAHRALGEERQSREILMAQRDDQLARTDPNWAERLWGKITKVTLGYGYQPWRALWFLAVVVALSCLLAVVLGAHGALAQTSKTASPGRSCTVVQQVSVGLDLNLPVGTSVARVACDVTKDSASVTAAWLTVVGWVLRVLAWVFAALFIAGFTSAVRKT